MVDVRVALSEENDRLIEENARLRVALKTISDITDYGTETATWRMTSTIHNANVIARAALTATPAPEDEPHYTLPSGAKLP